VPVSLSCIIIDGNDPRVKEQWHPADALLNKSARFLGRAQKSVIENGSGSTANMASATREGAGSSLVDEPGAGQRGRAHAAEQDPAQLGDVQHQVGFVARAPSLGAVGPTVERHAASSSSVGTELVDDLEHDVPGVA